MGFIPYPGNGSSGGINLSDIPDQRPIPYSHIGVQDGVAALDDNGTVPIRQLPAGLPSVIAPPAPTALGGLFSKVPVSHFFVTGINTSGTLQIAQPTPNDISNFNSSVLALALPLADGGTVAGVVNLTASDVALNVSNNASIGGLINVGIGGAIGTGQQLNTVDPLVMNFANGTALVPVTVLGSTITISRSQSIVGASGNPNSANANSGLSIWVVADADDKWLANGIASYCFSSAVSDGTDVPPGTAAAQATTFKAQVNGSSNRRAIGMYSVGVKNGIGTTCDAWGAEISGWNLGSSGVSDDPLLLDQPAPNSFGATRGLVLNSRYGSGFLGSQKPITCGLQFQTGDGRTSAPHDAASGWQNCIWISTNAQVFGGVGIYDNANASQGTTMLIGGQRKFIIDASTMVTSSCVAYFNLPNAAFAPSPSWIIGRNTPLTGTIIGGNHGIQLLTDASTNTNTSNLLQGAWRNDAVSPKILSYKSRATVIGNHAIVNSGDILFSIEGYGDDGVQDRLAGIMDLSVLGSVAAGHIPSIWSFSAADAIGNQITTLTIGSAGFRSPPRNFSALPSPVGGLTGTIACVNDSTVTAWGTTVTGGGSSRVMAVCDGSVWKVFG